MKKNVASFEEFCKMGVSDIVKDHYSGAEKGEKGHATLEDAKDDEVKGNGDAEHTEEVKAENLSDPKIQPKTV